MAVSGELKEAKEKPITKAREQNVAERKDESNR
jgi:hypothetical protein